MFSRANSVIAVLAVALLISVAVSVTLVSSNSQLSSDKTTTATRLQMNIILEKGQMAVQSEIERVHDLTADLALELRSKGLNGTEVRAELNRTLASCPFLIDISTYGPNGIILAVEPEQYRSFEGTDVSGYAETQKLLTYKMPVMTNAFFATEGAWGALYACPIFDQDGVFIGAVSVLFDVAHLMNGVLPQLSVGTPFTWWSMQMNGTEIYDTHLETIGDNLLTDPEMAPFTQLRAMCWRMVNETCGYGTYSSASMTGAAVLNKECYWVSVGSEGIQWRLVLTHPF